MRTHDRTSLKHLHSEMVLGQGRFLIGFLLALVLANTADAHSFKSVPAFPIHHALHYMFPASHFTAGDPGFGKSLGRLLTKRGLVDGHSSFLLSSKVLSIKPYARISLTAIKAGIASVTPTQPAFTGGTITGGTLQGDLYVNNSGTAGMYQNVGEFTGTVGMNIPATFDTPGAVLIGASSLTPNFQNSLTFSAQSVPIPPVNFGERFLGVGRYSGLWRHSFTFGQKLGLAARQPVSYSSTSMPSGGLFIGTGYRNTQGSSTYTASDGMSLYAFAFGNSHLNNPTNLFSSVTISQAPYVQFGNGLNQTIINGQILYPLTHMGVSAQSGSLMTMGSNPANTGTIGSVATDLSSFLFF